MWGGWGRGHLAEYARPGSRQQRSHGLRGVGQPVTAHHLSSPLLPPPSVWAARCASARMFPERPLAAMVVCVDYLPQRRRDFTGPVDAGSVWLGFIARVPLRQKPLAALLG